MFLVEPGIGPVVQARAQVDQQRNRGDGEDGQVLNLAAGDGLLNEPERGVDLFSGRRPVGRPAWALTQDCDLRSCGGAGDGNRTRTVSLGS